MTVTDAEIASTIIELIERTKQIVGPRRDISCGGFTTKSTLKARMCRDSRVAILM